MWIIGIKESKAISDFRYIERRRLMFYPTGREMAEIDRYSIEETGIPQLVLMEKAALSISCEIEKLIKEKMVQGKSFGKGNKKTARVLCVCESGNNGGDGVALARILCEKGCEADILFVGGLLRSTEAFTKQMEIARNCDVKIYGMELFEDEEMLKNYDIIVDAIFGVGLTREVKGVQREAVDAINSLSDNSYIVALDIPTGISSDNGKMLGCAVKADMTVTFGFTKLGMLFGDGREMSGKIIVSDIGFSRKGVDKVSPVCYGMSNEEADSLIPERKTNGNKGNFGRVLVVAGTKNMCGACIFAAEAAIKTGAGLVKIHTTESNREIIQTRLPEAMLVSYEDNTFSAEDIRKLDEAMDWATAIVCGPGLGTDDAAGEIVKTVLMHGDKPLIIDADGINCIVKYGYGELLKNRPNTVLTPHMLEAARLLSMDGEYKEKDPKQIVAEIIDRRIDIAREFANAYKTVLVLKDARTVVAGGEKVFINTTGNSGMAKGGSGDSLSGIISGLVGMGIDKVTAARLGVYIHGRSGDIAAEKSGINGIKISDMIECIGKAMEIK